MRHQHGFKKLGRTGSHRRALLRNLGVALFEHERIQTTHVKAQALRPWAERLITLAKRGDLSARRLAAGDVPSPRVLRKLFAEIGPRCASRPGGYTRILKLGTRRGDAAAMSLIELVDKAPQVGGEAQAAAVTKAEPAIGAT